MIRVAWSARGDASKAEFVANMIKVGWKRRSVYNTVKRLENNESMDRKPGQGKKVLGMTISREIKLCHEADHKVGLSFRKLARKYKINDKTVKKILKRNGITLNKRKDAPKISEKQEKVIKTRLRKLSRGPLKKENDHIDVIMDDESYFDENGMSFHGSNTFLSSDPKNEPHDIKYREKSKYPFKIMVWVAISKKGRSRFFVKKTQGAVNSEIYIKDCLKSKLLPFIKKYYPDDNYVFWPDLASSHYSKKTQDFMREEKINFIPKELNPPNCPNLRPIESFWSKIKREVYADGWTPKDADDLHEKVSKVMSKVGQTIGESFMSNVSKNVRLADRKGAMFNL